MSETAQPKTVSDERVKEMSVLRRALIRPELGGMVGAVAVFVFFLLFAFAGILGLGFGIGGSASFMTDSITKILIGAFVFSLMTLVWLVSALIVSPLKTAWEICIFRGLEVKND